MTKASRCPRVGMAMQGLGMHQCQCQHVVSLLSPAPWMLYSIWDSGKKEGACPFTPRMTPVLPGGAQAALAVSTPAPQYSSFFVPLLRVQVPGAPRRHPEGLEYLAFLLAPGKCLCI